MTNGQGWTLFILSAMALGLVMSYLFYRYHRRKSNAALLAASQQQPEVPEQVVAEVEASESRGWVTLSYQSLISLESSKLALAELSATRESWAPACDAAWWKGIQNRSRALCIKVSLDMKNSLTTDKYLAVRRRMSASAILYGFALPKSLWLFDEETALIVMKYSILTQMVNVNVEAVDLKEYVHVPDLLKRISKLMSLNVFTTMLSSTDRYPSFVSLFQHLVHNGEVYKAGEELILKKVLSCIFLNAEVCMPLDYLYVDVGVADFVMRTGEFEVLTKSILKVSQ